MYGFPERVPRLPSPQNQKCQRYGCCCNENSRIAHQDPENRLLLLWNILGIIALRSDRSSGGSGKVECFEHIVCLRVSAIRNQGGEVEHGFDEGEYGREVVLGTIDEPLPCIRGNYQGWNSVAVSVLVHLRRRNVVILTTVVVISENEDRVRPMLALHEFGYQVYGE